MKLHEIQPTPNSRPTKHRKARGIAAGKGKTAGRGMNGQNSRTGGGVRPGFEGGQLPWFRRLPKRGFHNFTHKTYQIVNLKDLNEKFQNDELVDVNSLHDKNLVKKLDQPVKILGSGTIDKKLNFKVDAISQTALKEILKNNGNIVK